MFDIGWVEMMVVIVVMIVVIGPKDLPVVLHTMGRWIARVRAMAREFQSGIEDLAQQAGIDDVRKEVNSIRDFSLEEEIEKTIDPEGELREGIGADTRAKERDEPATAPGTGAGDDAAAQVKDGAEGQGVLTAEAGAEEPEPAKPRRKSPAGREP
jgi:sec-independent protein translocase protein TatB